MKIHVKIKGEWHEVEMLQMKVEGLGSKSHFIEDGGISDIRLIKIKKDTRKIFVLTELKKE